MTREEKAQFCIDNPLKSPAFQFYPDHWFGSRHVTMMNPSQKGIYVSLLFAMWLEPACGIPVGEECLTARVSEDQKPSVNHLLTLCFFKYKKLWFNERLLDERIKQIITRKKRIDSGVKGGRPSKSRTNGSKANANHLISKSKAKENQICNSNSNNNNKKYSEDFLLFWGEYPRKEDKGNAFKAWKKICDDKKTIVHAARIFASICKKKEIEKKYIPMPSTWLNGSRWEDEEIQKILSKKENQSNHDKSSTVVPPEERMKPEEIREVLTLLNNTTKKLSIDREKKNGR